MPQKGSIVHNVFEQLEEFGKKTTKKTVQAVNQSFNPVAIVNELTTPDTENEKAKALEKLKKDKPNATPLDFQKLSEQYKDQDAATLAAVRRQFSWVKGQEAKAVEERKKEEEMRKKRELQEENEKKRQAQMQKKQQESDIAPRGKQRKSLFSPKKKAMEKHQETKPSVGKQ